MDRHRLTPWPPGDRGALTCLARHAPSGQTAALTSCPGRFRPAHRGAVAARRGKTWTAWIVPFRIIQAIPPVGAGHPCPVGLPKLTMASTRSLPPCRPGEYLPAMGASRGFGRVVVRARPSGPPLVALPGRVHRLGRFDLLQSTFRSQSWSPFAAHPVVFPLPRDSARPAGPSFFRTSGFSVQTYPRLRRSSPMHMLGFPSEGPRTGGLTGYRDHGPVFGLPRAEPGAVPWSSSWKWRTR